MPGLIIESRSKRQNRYRNYNRVQKIELEGDFNKYFNVYAAKKTQNEVLRILNPEFMAYLIDHTQGLTVEFHEKNLLIYGDKPFSHGSDIKYVLLLGCQIVAGLAKSARLIKDDAEIMSQYTRKPSSRWSLLTIMLAALVAIYFIFASLI